MAEIIDLVIPATTTDYTIGVWDWRDRIYVITEGPCGPTKIGITRNDKARAAAIQTGNPRPLTCLLSFACPHVRDIERRVHERLSRHRLTGEWFAVTPEEAEAAIFAIMRERCGDDARLRAPKGTFDRTAYQRELMRKRREKKDEPE